MSHAHHHHAADGHAHAHEAARAQRVHAAPELSGSILRASAVARLGVSAAIVAAIWAGVFWVVS